MPDQKLYLRQWCLEQARLEPNNSFDELIVAAEKIETWVLAEPKRAEPCDFTGMHRRRDIPFAGPFGNSSWLK